MNLDWEFERMLLRRSLLEVLSRVEIPFAICDKYSCRMEGALVAQIKDIHYENNVY